MKRLFIVKLLILFLYSSGLKAENTVASCLIKIPNASILLEVSGLDPDKGFLLTITEKNDSSASVRSLFLRSISFLDNKIRGSHIDSYLKEDKTPEAFESTNEQYIFAVIKNLEIEDHIHYSHYTGFNLQDTHYASLYGFSTGNTDLADTNIFVAKDKDKNNIGSFALLINKENNYILFPCNRK